MAKRGRRGHGEGSVHQRGDGRWVGVINRGWKNGKRHRKYVYGATQEEVVDRMADARKAAKDGVLVMDERQTVGDFLDRWFEDANDRLRPSTLRSYEQLLRVHIKPGLGHVALAKLAPAHLRAFMKDKLAPRRCKPCGGTGKLACESVDTEPAKCPLCKGDGSVKLSPRTVQYLHAIIRAALDQALADGAVSRNVAKLTKAPTVKRHRIQPLTPDEARRFLDAVRDDRNGALYTVAVALGLRLGEALGLRWQDTDLEAGMLRVEHALQRIKDKGLELVEPKSETSHRVIALPEVAILALRAHRVRQLEERLVAGRSWKEHGYVFPSSVGTGQDASNVRRQFKKALAKAGLPAKRFHDTRHTAATLLIAQGVHPRAIMETLGHSEIRLTMNTYGHVVDEVRREVANQMDAILTGTK